ncbi:unnamed protein product [Paramecium octaurelia]|uniref:MORN repeat protein n=1 Tax=Paramecium octaurelia TaxID=43137 RepID=A0A8S1YDX6_PAROT|nr:unnamed protein product [Paramecium octaurelia]
MNRITLNCQKYIKPPFYNNYTCQFYKLKLNFQYPNKQIRLNFQLKTWQFNFLQLQTDHSPNEFSQRQQNKNYIKMQLILEKQHYKYMRASLRRIKRKEQIRNSERKQYYYGNYVNELPQGEGINWSKSQNYIGQMYQGKKHGIGLYQGLHQDCYMGQWDNGKRCGSCLHINGFINVGKVTIDLKYGVGQEYLENGDFYIGEFRNGKPNGRGEYIWSNGNCYQGQFESGLRNGYGTWQSKTQSGKNCYKGYYANDKQCCEGIFEYSNGTINDFVMVRLFGMIFKGNWKQNQLQTFEKARISLNEFPQQHQIQKILENQETYSEIADEPDLDQIEDQFQMKFKNPMQKALFKIYLTIPVTMICIFIQKRFYSI